MNPYLAILGARFRTLLQYRAAALAGFATQLFWGLIRVMIFSAFYASTRAPQPISLADVVTYLWLTQALLVLAFWNVDADVRGMVTSGTVAYELLRPLDLYGLWYMRALAARVAPALLRAVPMFVVAGLFLGMRAPASPLAGLAFAAGAVLAALLAAALSALFTVLMVYTVSGDGLSRLAPLLTFTFSGALVPLPLLPRSWLPLFDVLPFRGLMDTPFRLYTGHIPPAQAVAALAHQLAWTVALALAGRAVLSRATRHLVVQGG